MGAGLFGSTYLLPVFVQTIQGYTPTQAGLLLMPAGLVMGAAFPIAGRMSDKVSAGLMIGAGLVLFAVSSWLTAGVNVDTAFWTLAWWTIVGRLGLSLLFPAISSASLKVLPPHLLSQGSGAMNFTRQLGGAFGTNLLAVYLERRTAFHGDALAATITPDNAAATAYLRGAGATMQQLGVSSLDQTAAAGWLLGQTVYYRASAMAFQDGFRLTAFVFVIALVPTWVLARAQRKRRRDDRPAIEDELRVEAGPAFET